MTMSFFEVREPLLCRHVPPGERKEASGSLGRAEYPLSVSTKVVRESTKRRLSD